MLATLLLSLILSWSGLTPAAVTPVATPSVSEWHMPFIQEEPVSDFVHDGYAHRTTKRNYFGTLVDISNSIKETFGWENLDLDATRRGAVWSSVGLLLALIISLLVIAVDKIDMLNPKDEEKERRSTRVKIIVAASLLCTALMVQNVLSVRYLVTALEFDFMVFGETPFFPFVGAFIAIAAVIALVFIYNVLLSAFSGFVIASNAKKQSTKSETNNAFSIFYGYILPIIGYVLIMLASLITFFNINILPFSFKVLRLGCILYPILMVVFAIYKKGSVLIAIPFGIIGSISLWCLGFIIAFFVQTISLLSVLAVMGAIVISFFFGGAGMGGVPIAFGGGDSQANSASQNSNSFSMDNMDKTPYSDGEGNEVFQRKSDGRLFKHTATGFQELRDDEVQK